MSASKRKDSNPSKNNSPTVIQSQTGKPGSAEQLKDASTADGSMEKNGANGSEVAAAGAGGATDWQKGNPQLSALLSQQAPAGMVINGAGAGAAAVSPALSSDNAVVISSGGGDPGAGSAVAVLSADDASSVGGSKDDEDDDNDNEDEDDKVEAGGDPERLKAFNMFVRLFVDENLDRHVPISRQPKEKIQAIIDSCTRQFPEYASRARKRIRTYLKSCRRTKRTREQAGIDMANARPTPPHLTSVQAEQLLARACENEAENAKRMRMGMEPVSQPMPITVDQLLSGGCVNAGGGDAIITTTAALTGTDKNLKTEYKSDHLATLLAATQDQQQQLQVTTVTPAVTTAATFPALNGVTVNGSTGSVFRPNFARNPSTVTTAAAAFPGTPLLLQQSPQPLIQNGPTSAIQLDNGNAGLKKPPLLNHKLNPTEIGAVRQLITGYRESAAFLLRSADELENLLQIQPKL